MSVIQALAATQPHEKLQPYSFDPGALGKDQVEIEAKHMDTHHVIDTHSKEELAKAAGSFNLILVTANVALDWPAYLNALAPKGRLHVAGVVPEPIGIPSFPLIVGQRSVSATPSGAPAGVARMLNFCARHGINAVTEEFPMSAANEALEHLESGKARYRIVLKNDLV
jgi:uncharacterized zinc-type alcohol dehydrogenase-like protein